ncbi:peptide-methionine (S)-S-oxide reductase, partial [bacterium]|nr:peptide-methionine (S)-S-oxide reductase [bacterium]
IQIAYDLSPTTFGPLLKIFFSVAHYPTQVTRQGNDRVTQYRSAIFYADDQQRDIAEQYVAQIEAANVFNAPIATRLEPLGDFFEAEAYHQNYAALNPGQGYIQAVSMPKVEKLRAYFGDRLKDG